MIRPLGFQWDYILCIKDLCADLSSDDNHKNSYDYSSENSYESNENQQSESYLYNQIELSLIKIEGPQIQSKIRIKDSQEDKLSIFNKFYIIVQEDTDGFMPYQYYQVMINNRRAIKFYVISDEILNNNQLKHSNYYLTRIINDQDYLLIMTKQSKSCKIIRKITFQNSLNQEKLVYNYSQVISFRNPKQKNQVQLINLWNLQKQNIKIESYEDIILTKNNNILVSSVNNCLKIIKIN